MKLVTNSNIGIQEGRHDVVAYFRCVIGVNKATALQILAVARLIG